jgi:hypothetical protein
VRQKASVASWPHGLASLRRTRSAGGDGRREAVEEDGRHFAASELLPSVFTDDYQIPGTNLHRTWARYAPYSSFVSNIRSSAYDRPMLQLVVTIITMTFQTEML